MNTEKIFKFLIYSILPLIIFIAGMSANLFGSIRDNQINILKLIQNQNKQGYNNRKKNKQFYLFFRGHF
jgi:hypothetical protein